MPIVDTVALLAGLLDPASRREEVNWEDAVRLSQHEFPSDYVMLQEYGGSLELNGWLIFPEPTLALQKLRDFNTYTISEGVDKTLDGHLCVDIEFQLRAFATNIDGDVLFWDTEQSTPDEWTIVIKSTDCEYTPTHLTLTELLDLYVSGKTNEYARRAGIDELADNPNWSGPVTEVRRYASAS